MTNPETSLQKMKKLGKYQPAWRIGFRSAAPADCFAQTLPIQKSWPAIGILAAFIAGFSIPLFTMGFNFREAEDLFDLTSILFTLFWAMGWSAGILIMLAILLALLFAREKIAVSRDNILLRLELFGFGFESDNPLPCLSNLRHVDDDKIKGSAWRGKHLAFDYLHVPVRFGSGFDSERAERLIGRINHALEKPIPASLPENIEHLVAENRDIPGVPVSSPGSAARAQTPTPVAAPPREENKRSLYFLIMANLIPVGGVLLTNWQIGDIMLLFWFESAIIGFYNILKLFRIAGPIAIFYSLFFVGHYGGFMAVHLLFIFALFFDENVQGSSLAEVAATFMTLWPAILALFISHGFSFADNFLRRKEYLHKTAKAQMGKPYTRIILMHITIIFGGFLVMALDAPLYALLLLLVMKIAVDLKAHGKEHASIPARGVDAAETESSVRRI